MAMRRLLVVAIVVFSLLGAARGAPRVLKTAPEDGATGVDPAAAITVVFSEPMDPKTLDREGVEIAYADKNLRFFRDPFLDTAYTYDAGTRTLTIKPRSLLPGKQILVLVTSKAKTLSGAPLLGPGEIRFKFSFWTKEAGPRRAPEGEEGGLEH
jgi:ABC-type transport system substrate-binding protein